MLAKLGSLELIAKTVVDGFLSGKHRSTHKGGCRDFAGYRPYARGDDIRQLDWRHYARSDRYYVRQFDDETNLQALLIADASGSMEFGLSTVTKWRYAQMAIASVAHLLLRQRDAVGLAIVGQPPLDFVRPMSSAAQLPRVLNMLTPAKPGGESSLSSALTALQGRLKRRGMIVLFTDGFCDVPGLKQTLEQFCLRGHDVVVCQILAPEELTFPFRRDALFEDLESSGRLRINPNAIRRHYQQEFQAFMDELHESMVAINVDLMTMTTADDLGEILAYYLHRRASIKTLGHARARS